jgi:hypothetical protein
VKPVQDLIAGAIASGQSAPVKPAPAAQLDPAAVEIVNRLFVELQAIFPAWRQAWPTDAALAAAKRNWVRAFMAAGIRDVEQIRYGLQQCRLSGSDFAPSVGKFIQWCRPTPEALGCPAVEQAYLQACRLAHPAADRSGAHAAVWHAACETGLHVLRDFPEIRSRPVFERAYSLTLEQVARGAELRSVPKALPASVSVPANPVKARSALDEMRRKLRATA